MEKILVDKMAPPKKVAQEAMTIGTRLSNWAPIGVQCVLKALTAGLYEGLDAGLEVEAEGSKIVRGTEDRKEGINAFLEKRRPHFVGR